MNAPDPATSSTNLPAFYREMRLAEQIEPLLDAVMVQKRARPDPQATDMLSVFLAGASQDEKKPTCEESNGHAFNFLALATEVESQPSPGPSSCSVSIQGCVPDLLDELDATLHGSAPMRKQLAGLSLLDGVVKESLAACCHRLSRLHK